MKNIISKFASNCRDFFKPKQDTDAFWTQTDYEKSYNDSLRYLEKCKASVAADQAYEWERHKYRGREQDIEETLDRQSIESRKSIPHEMDRRQGAERMIEMAKSYKPSVIERLQEKDGPDLERD
jgi:hypothetical protein